MGKVMRPHPLWLFVFTFTSDSLNHPLVLNERHETHENTLILRFIQEAYIRLMQLKSFYFY